LVATLLLFTSLSFDGLKIFAEDNKTEVTYEDYSENANVTVVAPSDMFEEGTVLDVTDISDDEAWAIAYEALGEELESAKGVKVAFSKDGEEVVSVAGVEREDAAKTMGGTFQKEFYRDTYGNEYFYDTKCGQSKYDWLLEEKRKGNNLTKAGANERASNYIYSHKLYRTADGDQVFVREDEEEDFQKTATERGWNPQEVVTKRWNGLDITGPADALMAWKLEFSDGGVLSDDMMAALGATEGDIEKGKVYQVEHIKKAYEQLREISR
jgi:hypothetical protein